MPITCSTASVSCKNIAERIAAKNGFKASTKTNKNNYYGQKK